MMRLDDKKLREMIAACKGKPTRVLHDGVEYGVYQEFGAEPHVIEATNAQALYWPGAAHPVKAVHHPGNPPRPFMTPAIEAARSVVAQAFSTPLALEQGELVIEAIARQAQRIAQALAPVDTGALRNSIDVHKPEEL